MQICSISQLWLPDQEQPRQHLLALDFNWKCSSHKRVCEEEERCRCMDVLRDRVGLRELLWLATSSVREETCSVRDFTMSWSEVSMVEIDVGGKFEIILSAMDAKSSSEVLSEPAKMARAVSGRTERKKRFMIASELPE